jgi:ComF family protein
LKRLDHEALLAALKPGPRVRGLVRLAADALFPPHAFDGGPSQGPGFSAEAWTKARFLEAPVCDGCGVPVEFNVGARCGACLAQPFAFARARAACLYDEVSRDLILKFKHADQPELASLFARWVGRAAAELLVDAEAVVPVPLHPSRLLRRRYNQAAEIARPLARAHDLVCLPDALVRARDTGSQGGRSGGARRRNVAGAFAVPPARRKLVKGRRILLVDDVMTTGATAQACAKALLEAGARAVDVAVVARVSTGEGISI